MTILVGVHDHRGTDRWTAALAATAGIRRESVVHAGSLAVAGAGSSERSGAITCIFNGYMHEAGERAGELALPAGTAPGLVVACGYARHGTAFLRQLRGAYQLVVWDDAEREAVIAQDHLSARAVFYHSDGSRTTFASDIAPLLAVLPRRPAPDSRTIPRWITDRSLPHGLTLYEGVRRLQMGWSLRLNQGRQNLRRLWEPPYVRPEPIDAAEAGAQIRAAVDKAVRRRLGPDGTTGILLSGGFDSGTLASTAAPILRERGHALPAYSTIFPGEPWDESRLVEILTTELGLPSTRVRVTGGTLSTALHFQERWKLPLPAPGAILDQPLLALAHQAGVRVMFDGQGGDELFAASPYLLTDYALRGRWGAARRLAHRFPGTGPQLELWQARTLLKQLVIMGAIPHAAHRMIARARPSSYADLDWLTPASRRSAEELDDPWAWKRGASGRPRWWALLAHMLVGARELVGMQDFLRRRGEMFGLESRQPLMVDVDLVELMLRIPPHLAFSPYYDRALARTAMLGIVPEPIRLPVRKSNYGELMHRTLAEDEFTQIRHILAARDAEVGAFVDLELVRRNLLERAPGPGETGWQAWGHRVWALATTELWLRAHDLGQDFPRRAYNLRLRPCRVQILAAPDTAMPQASRLHSAFFQPCARQGSHLQSPIKMNIADEVKHGSV